MDEAKVLLKHALHSMRGSVDATLDSCLYLLETGSHALENSSSGRVIMLERADEVIKSMKRLKLLLGSVP